VSGQDETVRDDVVVILTIASGVPEIFTDDQTLINVAGA
jgi:hypothetical protein